MDKQLPSRIKNWLNQRTISDDVILKYKIGWNGTHIVIPIHDINGNFLFNKYRRDPESEEGPKYRYEKGATSVLYGIEKFHCLDTVVLCEGELDALALISKGITAVSTTGGSSTFKEDWKEYFRDVEVIICYDTDDAGLRGAFHVQGIISWAKMIFLPKNVKDVTDFFMKLDKNADDFRALYAKSKRYELPPEWKASKTKKELKEWEKHYKEVIDGFMVAARKKREKYESDKSIVYAVELWIKKLVEVKRAIKYFTVKRGDIGKDRLARAKAVPIPQFINFNNDNTACCIWHKEKTPSMYYYAKQNRVKCFGCDKLGDVIDVIQQMHSVDIKKAIKIILNENESKA